jgi:uncharacterized coiled-coil protein SlyX
MSQFSFDPGIEEETSSENQHENPAGEPKTLALSADDFSALEERVLRAVNLVKRERLARSEAEDRAAKAEAKLAEQAPVADSLQNEVTALRAEREQVRQRVERLLSQLDALEL